MSAGQNIVWMEGFDHLNAALLTTKGWSANADSMQTGRLAGQCARITSGGNSAKTNYTLPSNYSTIYAGVALRSNNWSNSQVFFALRASTTSTCMIGCDNGGHLRALNSSSAVIATGTKVLSVSTWHYVEIKLVINGASGSITLQIDGANEFGPTTGNFGSTNVDNFSIFGPGSQTYDYDDIYVQDNTGSSPGFLGDVRVETLYPSGAGSNTQWTPDTGSNYARVNEHTSGTFPDGDTSYVSDSNAGDLDSYTTDDCSVSSGTVYAVQTSIYARKDDAGTRQISDLVRQSTTNYAGSTTQSLSTTYSYYRQMRNQDPTGSDWTITTVNGDEFGVKLVA